MIRRITCIAFLLISSSLNALEIRISGETPNAKENIWFGWVEASKAYEGKNKETVLEFFCHRMKLAEGQAINKENTILALPDSNTEEHFVATLRTPSMPVDKANELMAKMQTTTHFCYYPKAIESFKGKFADKEAMFLAGELVISDEYKVKDKE
ncbi:MAG: hypothetical protein ACI8SR_002678 [Oceanicoccus sp.]|jgi:hypothetical protein